MSAHAASAFAAVLSCRNQYYSDPERNFSRNSILDFETAFSIPYRLFDESITRTIPKLLKTLEIDPAVSSITDARLKILPEAYEDVFRIFNEETRSPRHFKGYSVYAIDGSEVNLYGSSNPHASPEEREHDIYKAKTKKHKERRFINVNTIFDVLEKTFVEFIIQPGSQKDEDAALLQYVRQLEQKAEKFILCADRGYENLMAFYIMQSLEQLFAVRIKDESSKGAFTKNLDLPDADTYDVDRTLLLKKDHRFQLLRKYGEIRPIKYIAAHDKYEEFDDNDLLELNVRIVRFCITDSLGREMYYTIATNLPRDEFSAEDIAEIYRQRWQIEIAFRGIKYDLSLEHLHSRHIHLIRQELYAAAFLYNYASRLRNEEQKLLDQQKKAENVHSKYQRTISLGYIISCIKIFEIVVDPITAQIMEESIRKKAYSRQPNRPDTRKQE